MKVKEVTLTKSTGKTTEWVNPKTGIKEYIKADSAISITTELDAGDKVEDIKKALSESMWKYVTIDCNNQVVRQKQESSQ